MPTSLHAHHRIEAERAEEVWRVQLAQWCCELRVGGVECPELLGASLLVPVQCTYLEGRGYLTGTFQLQRIYQHRAVDVSAANASARSLAHRQLERLLAGPLQL